MSHGNQGPWGGPPGGVGGGPQAGGYGGSAHGGGYGGPAPGGNYGGPAPGDYGSPAPGGYGVPAQGANANAGGFGAAQPFIPPAPGQAFPADLRVDGLAITSLVLGVLSMFFCLVGIPFGLGAVITGAMSMSNIGKRPHELKGKGLAVGGVVMGVLDIIVFLFALAFGFVGVILDKIK